MHIRDPGFALGSISTEFKRPSILQSRFHYRNCVAKPVHFRSAPASRALAPDVRMGTGTGTVSWFFVIVINHKTSWSTGNFVQLKLVKFCLSRRTKKTMYTLFFLSCFLKPFLGEATIEPENFSLGSTKKKHGFVALGWKAYTGCFSSKNWLS